jgi:hypothetical protein
MISFCDLPLGLIKPHIDKYGNYGIGMTKEWGINHKLNPVLYLERNSIIANNIDKSLDSVIDSIKAFNKVKSTISQEFDKKWEKDLKYSGETALNILRYVKNYKGDLIRGKKKYPDYRFYDEREWRYVPPYNEVKANLNEADYLKYRGNFKTKPLIESVNLAFTSLDIKYLIVKSNKDIPKLIRLIKSIPNLSKSSDEADVLTTKIMTVDQISDDI